MLEFYVQAWVIDEEMADLIRDAWYQGTIDEDQAITAWAEIANRCTATSGKGRYNLV